MNGLSYMDRNLAEIRRRIEDAKGRRMGDFSKDDVTLLAAIKYTDAAHVNYLHKTLGISDVGENRVQQLLERWDQLDREGLRIHFIGKLQSNKVKYIIDKVSMIESLDSIELAKEIEKQAAKHGKVMDCLIEINIGDEASKGGIPKGEALAFAEAVSAFEHIRLCGIMTMAPKCTEIDEYRKYFRESYHIFIDICEKKLHNVNRCILSMGMSGSFTAALAEGANLIRVGRAAFQKEE